MRPEKDFLFLGEEDSPSCPSSIMRLNVVTSHMTVLENSCLDPFSDMQWKPGGAVCGHANVRVSQSGH